MPESQSADAAFLAYRSNKRFALRAPDLQRKGSEDELELISVDEGLTPMPASPATGMVVGTPRPSRPDPGSGKYLWVVSADGLPVAVEDNQDPHGVQRRKRPSRGYLSHTNLTGGAPAHSGGEMWFTAESEICINGASSRYQPRSPEELNAVAEGFAAMGYRVLSMGWESGIGQPARNLKEGSIQWFEAAA